VATSIPKTVPVPDEHNEHNEFDEFDEQPKGEFVGTPAYMSPEQASGLKSALDPRSDLYGAAVLFHELLSLRHYLAHCQTLQQILLAIATEPVSVTRLMAIHHPQHRAPPAEMLHFLAKALSKNPAARFQSAEDMIDELQGMRDGRIRVQCPVTLLRRTTAEFNRWLGRSPVLAMTAFYTILFSVLASFWITARVLLTSAH
jgi:serine/threonine-protein kinase